MGPRSYSSAARDDAAEKTRARIVAAATKLLLSKRGAAGFSLEAVARAAGVTRLTVYNHFGARRALLEAVFDDTARRGGLFRIGDALSDPDPAKGLSRLIAIFCEFWRSHEQAIFRLLAAGALDPEFAESIRARNARRRHAIAVLVARIAGNAKKKSSHGGDLVDTLFALTSHAFFSELTSSGRTAESACAIIEQLARDALDRTMASVSHTSAFANKSAVGE